MNRIIKCRSIHPGRAEGLALVSHEVFPLSGVTFDLAAGRITWPGHPLHGQSVRDRILVLPKISAFAGGDWALLALCKHYRSGPRAILCTELPPMLVAGAVLGKLVTIAQLPLDVLSAVGNGDFVEIDTLESLLTIKSAKTGEVFRNSLQAVSPQPLQLTEEETAIADGTRGAPLQDCLNALIAYGQALNASKLIPIASVHAAGAGYNTTGEAAIAFLQNLAEGGLKTSVPATLNPIAVDLQQWDSVLGLPAELSSRQRALNDAYEKLGFVGSYSCKPYWTRHAPASGANFVSSEHNVVSFANSVLGARTNFEANIMAVLAAMTGRIPYYGLYLDENRRPSARVRVNARPSDALDWRCLGVAAARRANGRIPFFEVAGAPPDRRELRDLCAAFGPPWTSVPMLHVDQVTPGFHAAREAARSCDQVVIGAREIEEVREEFFLPTNEPIDLVALGCPQASIEDVKEIAEQLEGKRIAPSSRLWVWTDAETATEARSLGLAAALERSGAKIISDTCGCAACPIDRSSHRIRNVATDSTKSLGFLQRTGVACHLGGLELCIEAALTGRWPTKFQH